MSHAARSGAVLLAVLGCVGRVEEGGSAAPPGRQGPPPIPTDPVPPRGDGPDGGGPAIDPPAACGTPGGAPGAAPWRAVPLTREQYIHAASDLLGFDVRSLVRFADAGGRKFIGGVSPSALELEQRAATAEAIAAAAVTPARLAALLPCDAAQPTDACATQLIERLGLRAFRRPLGPEGSAALRKLFDAGKAAGGFTTGVEWLLVGIFQAPDFLYQLAPRAGNAGASGVVPLDDYTVASRLSLFLWSSGPDAELLAAASKRALGTPAAVEAQVRRMLADPRAARMREDYYASWLKLDGLATVAREAPEFTPAVATALARSAMEGIHDVYQKGGRVETLLGTATVFADAALARLYGLPAPPATATGLAPAQGSAQQRRGLITHPALLALLAHPDGSDPIKRGVFVTEALLCKPLPDPAPNIPDLPAPRPGLSTRQRLEQHRSAPVCASCHQLFDPVGLALENYDSIGRHRTTDQNVAIDSSAEVQLDSDLDGKYDNGLALLARFPTSTTVRDCMVQHWLEYALRRDLIGADSCAADGIKERFRARGDLGELLTAIATSDPFRNVAADTTGAAP